MASPAPSTDSTQDETQFIPQSDDEETLWKVIEITAERPKQYKVKWEGINPDTGKPWAQSWVPKSDCTDDLRKVWKKKLKLKNDTKKGGKGKSRLLTTSKGSTPSTSTVTGGRNHSATVTVTGSRPPESNVTSRSRTTKSSKSSKRKRRSEEAVLDIIVPLQDDQSEQEILADPEPEAAPSRPRKRRKFQDEAARSPSPTAPTQDQGSYDLFKGEQYGKVPPEDHFKEARDASELLSVKAKKGKGKGRPQPEVVGEGEEVPLSKMGPPRGIKKNSITGTQSKPKSTSISRPLSRSEVLPPLKLISKPKKSKPSPNRFRSAHFTPLHAGESPTRPKMQLSQNDNMEYEMDMEDDINLGYFELYEQLHHSTFSPSSDDGDEDSESSPPSAAKVPAIVPVDRFADLDEIRQLPSQAQSPSVTELPSSGLERHQPGNLILSFEVPETQSQKSSNIHPGLEKSQPDIVVPDAQQDTPADAAASTPGMSKELSTSEQGGSALPLASTSKVVPVTNTHSRPRASKPLRPVPQLSPSQFHPHLPARAPTLAPTPDDGEVETASPSSSIDSFSSPEKRKTRDSLRLESIKNWGDNTGTSRSSQLDINLGSSDALRARVQELADNEHEKRERERRKARHVERGKPKRTHSDVIRTSSMEPEFRLDRTEESIIVQEMEAAYVDLSGGGGEEQKEVPVVPSAQEGSTQDLECERGQQMKRLSENDVQPVTANRRGADLEMDTIEQTSADLSIAAERRASKSKPTSRSESTSVAVVRVDVTVEELPPTLSPPGPPTPDAEALTRVQTERPLHSLMDAMNLLNVKSEEIKRLEANLDKEHHKNAALTLTMKDLEDALASAQELASQPSSDAIALAEIRTQRLQEQISWDAERATYVTSLESAMRSKTSAESDRDFFRDQYAQASSYVSTVRGENVELEQRALVAEGKAKDGVGMIKAMFEGQVKSLLGDLAQWKGIAELLQEKDRRTGDEIRRKAAEEPELRAKYAESQREIEKLKAEVHELSRERNILKLKLSNFKEQVERTIKGNEMVLTNGDDTSHGDELVYRCLWRSGGDSEPCLTVFTSSNDLEMHMYADQHLISLGSEQLIESEGNINGREGPHLPWSLLL